MQMAILPFRFCRERPINYRFDVVACFATVEGKQFVREGPRFATKQSKGFRPPFGGFGQSPQSGSNTSQGIYHETYDLSFINTSLVICVYPFF